MNWSDAEKILHEIILDGSNHEFVDMENLIPFIKERYGLDTYLSLSEHGIANLLESDKGKEWYVLDYEKHLMSGDKTIATITIKHS